MFKIHFLNRLQVFCSKIGSQVLYNGHGVKIAPEVSYNLVLSTASQRRLLFTGIRKRVEITEEDKRWPGGSATGSGMSRICRGRSGDMPQLPHQQHRLEKFDVGKLWIPEEMRRRDQNRLIRANRAAF